MRRRSLLRIRSVSYGGCWSMRLKRRPLLQTSSPLNHQLRTYIGIGTANGGTSTLLLFSVMMMSPSATLFSSPQKDKPAEVDRAEQALRTAKGELEHAGGEWGGHR